MTNVKYREFWIVEPEHQLPTTIPVMNSKPCHPDHIHVVEHGALVKLQAELEELRFFAKQMNKYVMPGDFDTEDSALMAFKNIHKQNDIYRQALEFYANKKTWESRWIEEGDEDSGGDIYDVIDRSDVSIQKDKTNADDFIYYTQGGKRARKALAEAEKVENGK